ncbi:hemin uptake protein HemP [Alienimonas chondri]|uniref:Hemin uptake protein HemP n=1 Tax=Alienimonas chondri TaxID=2681879 RepID=A0ABX1VJ14_9PLAN|nr:hemin uptake protein HemP [Alienimonas chondri]NNJ28137.1 hypothetical protein [Alienimonas chondri]
MPAPQPPDPLSSQAQTPVARPSADGAAADAAPRPGRVRFEDLAGEAVEIEVEHAGQIYRLRRTKTDKLLLTK